MRFTVQHDYVSSLCDVLELGRLHKGDTVELTAEAAALVNMDSPGTLKAERAKPKRKQAKRQTRQVTAADKDR